jgi:hypothetical protein
MLEQGTSSRILSAPRKCRMCIASSITYRSDLHFAIESHRSLLGGVHSKDCGLGKVDDREYPSLSQNSAVVDGEGTAGHVLDGKLIVASLLPKFCNSLFYLNHIWIQHSVPRARQVLSASKRPR